jgi:hypothetical protein
MTASETQTSDKQMDHDQLVTAVRKQIEYYFSKENLQTDSYLISQMDANMSVPIPVVMKVCTPSVMRMYRDFCQ